MNFSRIGKFSLWSQLKLKAQWLVYLSVVNISLSNFLELKSKSNLPPGDDLLASAKRAPNGFFFIFHKILLLSFA